jgi:hypothetical protein
MKKTPKRKKLIDHATAQKIVVGIQVASLALELNDLLAEAGKDREEKIVRTVVTTLKDIRATLRTRG